jgi:hypothetical protein
LLLDVALTAELAGAVDAVLRRIQDEAAVAGDVSQLLASLPPLVQVLRYGTVREIDRSLVRKVIDGIAPRIFVGLPNAVASLDDDGAQAFLKALTPADQALTLLDDQAFLSGWRDVLAKVADQRGVHGLIAGRCIRMLLDAGAMPNDEAVRRLRFTLATSVAEETQTASAFIEGLLAGSGLMLLHRDGLLNVINERLVSLPAGAFDTIVPLVRRTFSTFAPAERRNIGQRLFGGRDDYLDLPVDDKRAAMALPLLRKILGLSEMTG